MNDEEKDTQNSTRYWLIDLLRILSMTAIIGFHIYETVVYQDLMIFSAEQSIYHYLPYLFQPVSFSGFTVLLLSAFLYGRRPRSKKSWFSILGFIGAGVIGLAWAQGGNGVFSFFFEWDIYSYLFISFLSLFLVRESPRLILAMGSAGAVMLWIPFWSLFQGTFHPFFESALIGVCEDGGGGWPLLPWIGLFWAGYGLGFISRDKLFLQRASAIKNPEFVFWVIVLFASLSFLGGYDKTPVGPGFSCFIYRRPPEIFWSHIIWILFAIRLSLLTKFNSWLGKSIALRWISSLHWSRHFGVCYLIQIILLGLAASLSEPLTNYPRLLDLVFLGMMPATEGLSRLSFFIRSKVSKVG